MSDSISYKCKPPKCLYSKIKNECVKPNPYTIYISNCIKNGTDIDKCRINYYKNKDKIKKDVCNLVKEDENGLNFKTCPRYRRPINNKCPRDYKVIKLNRYNIDCCYKRKTKLLLNKSINGEILKNSYKSPSDFLNSIKNLSLKNKINLFDQLLKSSDKKSKELLKSLSKENSFKSLINSIKSSKEPSIKPSKEQSLKPSKELSIKSLKEPSLKPSKEPSIKSLKEPSLKLSKEPSIKSLKEPSIKFLKEPSLKSLKEPSLKSLEEPSIKSLKEPSLKLSKEPSFKSLKEPSLKSLEEPSLKSLKEPSINVFYKSKESPKLFFDKNKNKYYNKIDAYQNKIKPIKVNKIKSLTPKKETPKKPKSFFQKILNYIGIKKDK